MPFRGEILFMIPVLGLFVNNHVCIFAFSLHSIPRTANEEVMMTFEKGQTAAQKGKLCSNLSCTYEMLLTPRPILCFLQMGNCKFRV